MPTIVRWPQGHSLSTCTLRWALQPLEQVEGVQLGCPERAQALVQRTV